ncbi:MAG: polar amino acid transport system substrate-binding protein [Alphaproteobacteria bacterium]|nr:polar amino acid transport system substrate-binding protein [Alphaproteobacteria bacterium]
MIRIMYAAIILLAGASVASAQNPADTSQRGSTVSNIPSDVVKDLAPTGTLRAGINLGNMVLAQTDEKSGEPKGITVDLARELGRRLGVPVELVRFDAAGKTFEGLKAGALDVVFLAIEPVRAAEVAFTAPYVIIEGVYLVPKDSALKTVGDVDRAGVRVGVNKGSAYDLFLTRTLKAAQLVRGDSGIDLFVNDKLDAAAGVKQPLVEYAKTNPAVRVMDGRFMEIQQAMGTPVGRDAGAKYLRQFVEEMKASGFVADALKRSNQPDAAVAPPATN